LYSCAPGGGWKEKALSGGEGAGVRVRVGVGAWAEVGVLAGAGLVGDLGPGDTTRPGLGMGMLDARSREACPCPCTCPCPSLWACPCPCACPCTCLCACTCLGWPEVGTVLPMRLMRSALEKRVWAAMGCGADLPGAALDTTVPEEAPAPAAAVPWIRLPACARTTGLLGIAGFREGNMLAGTAGGAELRRDVLVPLSVGGLVTAPLIPKLDARRLADADADADVGTDVVVRLVRLLVARERVTDTLRDVCACRGEADVDLVAVARAGSAELERCTGSGRTLALPRSVWLGGGS